MSTKAMTFVPVDPSNIGSTGESVYLADVKKQGAVQVFGVIDLKKEQKSDVNGQWGKHFLSVHANGKDYERVGYNVFAKSVLAVGDIQNIVSTPECKTALEQALSKSTMQNAFSRQRKALVDSE